MQVRILVVDSRQDGGEVGARLVRAIAVSGYAPAVIARLDERAVASADGAAGAFVDLGCSLGAGAEVVRRLRAARPDLPIVPYSDTPRTDMGIASALQGRALARDPGPITRAMVALSRARGALRCAIARANAAAPEAGGLDPDPLDLAALLLRYREAHVLAALRRHPSDWPRAAQVLDVPESTLRSWNDPRSDQRKFTRAPDDPVAAGALVQIAPAAPPRPGLLVVDVGDRPTATNHASELARRFGVMVWLLVREHDVVACAQRVAPLAVLVRVGGTHASGFGLAAAFGLARELPELPVLLFGEAPCAQDCEPAAHLGVHDRRVPRAAVDELMPALVETGKRSREFENAKTPHACGGESAACWTVPPRGLYEAERELERAVILRALQARGGSKTRAAEALLLTPQSLWRRMKRLRIA